jgi:hypothetical protein
MKTLYRRNHKSLPRLKIPILKTKKSSLLDFVSRTPTDLGRKISTKVHVRSVGIGTNVPPEIPMLKLP